MKLAIKVLFLYLLLICPSLYAIEVEGLYETEVISQSEQKRDKAIAIKKALKIVLTRILNEPFFLHDQTVKKILVNAKDYVKEFQYSLVATEQNNVHARVMRVLFDEKHLVSHLRLGKIGVWNEIRPRTLIWLVVEKKGQQQFFNTHIMPNVDLALGKASKQLALPILYPMQDLEENRTLSVADVLSAYSDHLLDVSRRYDVVSTLAGKLVQHKSCWKAEWSFYFDGKIMQWRTGCMPINKVILNGLQGVYQHLSHYYSVKYDVKSMP